MSNTKTVSNTGCSFSSLLTVLFAGLKLTGHISWPWIWVASPIWISFIVGFTTTLTAVLIKEMSKK